MKLEKLIKKIEVRDTGRYYEVSIETKDEKVIFPILGDILDCHDIVAFTDGKLPQDLTKQNWIDLYCDLEKNGNKKRRNKN